MRATALRRTAIAASVASLALLATACGGSDSGGKDGGDKTGTAKPDSSVKALTAAELEKAALAQGDVKGNKITEAGAADVVAAADLTVDKKECLPFAHAFYGVKQDASVATAQRQVTSEPKVEGEGSSADALASALDLTSTLVSLASYDGGDAAGNVTGVREAAAACEDGFTIDMGGDKQKVTKLTELKVKGGEEALAWTVMTEDAGRKAPLKFALVRQAGTVAAFSSFNLAATGGGVADFPLPTAVVDAQVAKLG